MRPPRTLRPASPDDDDAFLAQVRARAESQRRDAEVRRRAEQAEEENRQRGLRRDRDDRPGRGGEDGRDGREPRDPRG